MMREKNFSFQKAWEVLFPYLIYYLIFNAAFIIVAFGCQAGMKYSGEGYGQFMTAYADTVSGVAEGLCRLLAILPLVPMLKKELLLRGEPGPAVDGGTGKRIGPVADERMKKRLGTDGRTFTGRRVITGVYTVIFAVSASLGLNVLFALTGFAGTSDSYQQVADRQYGVAFGIGLVLYGLVSPLAEEVVFRGIIYNRLRRFYGPLIGIAASALFFGIFHGNLVQGVYGTVVGICIAYVYERRGSFLWPVFFHAAANLTVYAVAHFQAVQAALFTPLGCAILLAVAVLCAFLEEKGREK